LEGVREGFSQYFSQRGRMGKEFWVKKGGLEEEFGGNRKGLRKNPSPGKREEKGKRGRLTIGRVGGKNRLFRGGRGGRGNSREGLSS